MKQPEPEPRDCIVIVRVSQVEEAENLLIDEVEPQKAVIFARTAVKRKREIRWISNCSQNMPGCRYEECNEESADGAQPLQGTSHKKLLGHEEIQYACGDRKYRANQTL